jgi:hypothetical protein
MAYARIAPRLVNEEPRLPYIIGPYLLGMVDADGKPISLKDIDQSLTEAFRERELTWRSCWVKGPPFGPEWVQTDRETVILPSFTLALELAADPKARLDELTERLPSIRKIDWFTEISESVTEGWFGIF